jgi:hypothetical protein
MKSLFRESEVSLGLVSVLFRADLRCIYNKICLVVIGVGLKCIYGWDRVC